MSQLPIHAVMPQLLSAVREHTQVILKAAPGAGKSTAFPLELLRQQMVAGKIIMLEPRRLAARNIAAYLARQLGERVGQTVGYRMRGENKTSSATRLEIVTEGVMTRMIQSDPELNGVAMLIFDEFHERSIHADTALALSLEVQEALRDDLSIVVMSATLDSQAMTALLPQAAYIESQGRTYPIDYRYQPVRRHEPLLPAMARQIRALLDSESGSMLVFLPGVAAIRHLTELLDGVPARICPLYGQLTVSEQQQAIAPSASGERKVVLATNIAETSLTIEGIRLVVDSGLERVARFDLRTGITRLEQVRIAQSSAAQRAGRAGRLEPGCCVRMYSESQLNQQPVVPEAEILHADLSSLAMELSQWGCSDVGELKWLDVPSDSALHQARALLQSLGMLDGALQLTSLGRRAHQLGVEPRMAAALLHAQAKQAKWLHTALAMVALLEDPERNVTDLQHSLHRLHRGQHARQSMVLQRARTLAERLGSTFELGGVEETLLAQVAATAFPDRVAQRRRDTSRYTLANGHGAELRDDDPLARHDWLVVIDLMRGQSSTSQIFLALGADIIALEQHLPALFSEHEQVEWDETRGRLSAQAQTKLGSLVVRTRELPQPGAEKMTEALLNYVRRHGLSVLNWTAEAESLLARTRCAAEWLPEEAWPEMDEATLLAELEAWLEPYMQGIASLKQLASLPVASALQARLGWPLNQQIDEWLPTYWCLPTGSHKALHYQPGQAPMLSVRMQEVFGEQDSPTVAKGRQRVVLELLSPAQRPLQLTSDLAGFWAGTYKEVQKEMKGRYPKHVWPDDPASHVATTKTKRQLNS